MPALNRAICFLIIEFWEWFTLTYRSSARCMMCKYFLSVCSLNFHSLKIIFYKADLNWLMPKLPIFLSSWTKYKTPINMVKYNKKSFCFCFCFACLLPPVNFHLQSLQSGLTSFQVNFLLILMPIPLASLLSWILVSWITLSSSL